MTLADWAQIAEIIAAVAVIASLIYVAKQLRQNTDALVAQSRQSLLAGSHSELSFEIENPEMVTCMLGNDDPPPEQQVKVHAWMCMVFRAREYAWLQYRNGVIDESLWNTEVAVMLFFFDSRMCFPLNLIQQAIPNRILIYLVLS